MRAEADKNRYAKGIDDGIKGVHNWRVRSLQICGWRWVAAVFKIAAHVEHDAEILTWWCEAVRGGIWKSLGWHGMYWLFRLHQLRAEAICHSQGDSFRIAGVVWRLAYHRLYVRFNKRSWFDSCGCERFVRQFWNSIAGSVELYLFWLSSNSVHRLERPI